MIEWILEGIKDAFYWFLDLVFDVFGVLVGAIFDALPSSWQTSIATGIAQVQPYFDAINRWIPVQEMFGMFLTYMAILLLFSIIKIVVKMIPGIG